MKIISPLLTAIALLTAGYAQADSQVTVHDQHSQHSLQIDHAQNLAQLVTNPALHT